MFDMKQPMAAVGVFPIALLLMYVQQQNFSSKFRHVVVQMLGWGVVISSCFLLPRATPGEKAIGLALALYGVVSALWALQAMKQPEA